MDLLQYPKHFNISGLPKKCGKTPRLLLCRFSLRCKVRKQQKKKQHYNNKVKICSTTGGGWLAHDSDHPSENLNGCRCGFLAATRLPLQILCGALLHHHVHQHPLAGSHQLGPLPEDCQALWEVCPSAGPCWSDTKCSCLGGNAIISVTQRYSKWQAATAVWKQTEVHVHEEPGWLAVAWRFQLLLSGSYELRKHFEI